MNLILLITLITVSVTASNIVDDPTHIHGENGWYIPSKNGSVYWMDKEKFEAVQKAEENSKGLTLTPTKFYLYTRKNSKKAQQITDSDKSIKKSNFNPKHSTKFLIHGFTQGKGATMNKDIRYALLQNADCNVIVVDWARARSLDYISSVAAVPKVGAKVANMMDYLVWKHRMTTSNLTVIGHSLGAHVAGYAGKNFKSGRIAVIVGLDPALPGFDYKKPKKRLNSDDAKYVETIQTNGGTFGFLLPIGKAAFFPNGGQKQPGCFESICSHSRSIVYYKEALAKDNFAAITCENLESAVAQTCGDTYSSVRMGADENAFTVAGIFGVPVKKKSPFGVFS